MVRIPRRRDLTPPSSGRFPAGCARFQPPLMSNVRPMTVPQRSPFFLAAAASTAFVLGRGVSESSLAHEASALFLLAIVGALFIPSLLLYVASKRCGQVWFRWGCITIAVVCSSTLCYLVAVTEGAWGLSVLTVQVAQLALAFLALFCADIINSLSRN
jgi:hypothetical protein